MVHTCLFLRCTAKVGVIASGYHNVAAGCFDPPRHTRPAFRSLVPRTDFSVIEHIFRPDSLWRQVWHDNICAGKYSHLSTPGMNRSECRGRREKRRWKH